MRTSATTRPAAPAYIIEAASRLAASAPDFEESVLVAAFTALGVSAPAAPSKRPGRRAA